MAASGSSALAQSQDLERFLREARTGISRWAAGDERGERLGEVENEAGGLFKGG